RDLDQDMDFDRALDRDIAVARALDRAGAYYLSRAHSLSRMIIEYGMITAEQIAGFVEACKTLDQSLSHRKESPEAVTQEIANALEGLANALDVPRLVGGFSDCDTRQCVEFLICTQRIFECREAAERVTQAGWDQVCERLFALPGST